jgi:hypothetical protein
MYVVIGAIIFGLFFLGFNIIKETIFKFNKNPFIVSDDIYYWFYGILFLNVLYFIAVQFYNYHLDNNIVGSQGKTGLQGLQGIDGTNTEKTEIIDCSN